jgi:hypothetical protein
MSTPVSTEAHAERLSRYRLKCRITWRPSGTGQATYQRVATSLHHCGIRLYSIKGRASPGRRYACPRFAAAATRRVTEERSFFPEGAAAPGPQSPVGWIQQSALAPRRSVEGLLLGVGIVRSSATDIGTVRPGDPEPAERRLGLDFGRLPNFRIGEVARCEGHLTDGFPQSRAAVQKKELPGSVAGDGRSTGRGSSW